jgi:hypothetical protein
MCSNKGVESRVIEDAQARLVISQMVVCWLIIIIEYESSTTSNNSLRWIGNCKATDLVQRAVESLHSCESPNVPNTEHARNISRDDLVRSWKPFHSNQRMVVSFKQENLLLHIWVPNIYIVIKTSTQQKMLVIIPIKRIYT